MNLVGRGVSLGLALYTLVLGLLGGMLVERIRFDRARIRTFERFEAAEHRLHARLMELERSEATTGLRQGEGLPRK